MGNGEIYTRTDVAVIVDQADATSARPGAEVHTAVRVVNHGPATSVGATLTISAGQDAGASEPLLALRVAAGEGVSCELRDAALVCPLPPIPAGTSLPVEANAEVIGLGMLQLAAAVSDRHDASPGNDRADFVASMRGVPLQSGWQLVAWTGPETPSEQAAGAIEGDWKQIYAFDAIAQRFEALVRALPFASSLHTLQPGAGLWVQAGEGTADWTQPSLAAPRDVRLRIGWNLVAWTGPDGFPVVDAVQAIADSLEVLFVWDADSETSKGGAPIAHSSSTRRRLCASARGSGF